MSQGNLDTVGGGSKPWYASKTIWGGIVMAGALGTGLFGFHLDPETQAVLVDQFTAFAVALMAIAGTLLTIVGRFKAQKTIGTARAVEGEAAAAHRADPSDAAFDTDFKRKL